MCQQKHDEKLSNTDYINSLRKLSQDSAMKILYKRKRKTKKTVNTSSKLHKDILMISNPPSGCPG